MERPRSRARLQLSSGPEPNGSREKSRGRLWAHAPPQHVSGMRAAAWDTGFHFPRMDTVRLPLVDSVVFLSPQLLIFALPSVG